MTCLRLDFLGSALLYPNFQSMSITIALQLCLCVAKCHIAIISPVCFALASLATCHQCCAVQAFIFIHTVCLACSQALGLHCISASVEVGNTVLTASQALLSALATLASISKQRKAASAGSVVSQHIKKEPRSRSLTAAAFDKIVASLPDQVGHKDHTQQTSAIALVHAKTAMKAREAS